MTTHNTSNYLTMTSQNRLTAVTTISSNYVNISNFSTNPQEVNRPHFTPVKKPLHTTCSYLLEKKNTIVKGSLEWMWLKNNLPPKKCRKTRKIAKKTENATTSSCDTTTFGPREN